MKNEYEKRRTRIMDYTLLIIWSDLKPHLYHSDNRKYLEDLVEEFKSTYTKGNKYYIFKNDGCDARRIVGENFDSWEDAL